MAWRMRGCLMTWFRKGECSRQMVQHRKMTSDQVCVGTEGRQRIGKKGRHQKMSKFCFHLLDEVTMCIYKVAGLSGTSCWCHKNCETDMNLDHHHHHWNQLSSNLQTVNITGFSDKFKDFWKTRDSLCLKLGTEWDFDAGIVPIIFFC